MTLWWFPCSGKEGMIFGINSLHRVTFAEIYPSLHPWFGSVSSKLSTFEDLGIKALGVAQANLDERHPENWFAQFDRWWGRPSTSPPWSARFGTPRRSPKRTKPACDSTWQGPVLVGAGVLMAGGAPEPHNSKPSLSTQPEKKRRRTQRKTSLL